LSGLAQTIPAPGPVASTAADAERAALEQDRLFRIRYLIAHAYGVGPDVLTSPPPSVKAAHARSLAIAVARDIL
jgi:hypothetical protein